MAASWPSNSDAALTKRNGLPGSGGFMLLAGKMGYRRVTRSIRSRAAPCPPQPPVSQEPQGAARAAPSPWAARRRRGDGHALKRDAVILAAARAFRERGYHNTSLDDLAASLKVTKPTLYLYVPSKEAILFECFRAGLAQIQATLDDCEGAAGPGARAAVRLHPRICRGYCRGLRLVHAARRRPAPGRRDEPAHQTTQGGHRPAHARAHRGRCRRRLDPRLRHQA